MKKEAIKCHVSDGFYKGKYRTHVRATSLINGVETTLVCSEIFENEYDAICDVSKEIEKDLGHDWNGDTND